MAADDAAWRQHLSQTHEWDPSGEPTYIGDVLLTIALGFVAFLSLMMSSLCTSSGPHPRGCDALGVWVLAGGLSFLAGLVVLATKPVQRIRRRTWIASGGATAAHHGRKMSPPTRKRLRRIDAVASAVILAAFLGVVIAAYLLQGNTEQNELWTAVAFACLVLVLVAGLVRSRVRKRMLV